MQEYIFIVDLMMKYVHLKTAAHTIADTHYISCLQNMTWTTSGSSQPNFPVYLEAFYDPQRQMLH